jgi:hypothetical protein
MGVGRRPRVACVYIVVQTLSDGTGFEHASMRLPRQFQKLQLPLGHSLSQRQIWAVAMGASGHFPLCVG